MKKIIPILLLSCALLAACGSKSEESQTSTSSSLDPRVEKFQKEYKEALTDPHADFPQLSDQVTDDQALVKLVTNKGDITIKLFPKQAPLAVENFLTHAKEDYYNGVIFHRVIKDFMIQAGDPLGNGTGGESIWQGKDASKDKGTGFAIEPSPFLYNIRGALAMANTGQPNSNGSQFFINQNKDDQSGKLNSQTYPAKIIEAYKNGGNPSLDMSYTVFGQVTEGMDVVDQIATVETENDKPKEDLIIERIEVLKDYQFKAKK